MTTPPAARRRAAIALAAIAILAVIATVRVRRALEARRAETILAKAQRALETDPTAAIAWLGSYPADAVRWDTARGIALDARRRGVARHVLALPAGRRPEALAFEGKGELLLAAFVDRKRLQWSLPEGDRTRDIAVPSDGPAAFLGFGLLVVAAADGVLLLVPPDEASRRIGETGGPVRALAASGNGKWVAAAGDGAFTLASASGTVHRRLAAPEGRVASIALAPDGAYLAAALEDQSAWVYTLGSGRGRALEGRLAKLPPILFVPGREPRLLTAGEDGALSLWSLPSGDPRRLPGGPRPAVALAVSADGARAATADEAGDLRVWDMASGEAHLLGAHPGRVAAIALSPSGELLASAAQDGTLLLWDVATAEHQALRAQGGVEAPLVFSHDGRWLATGGRGEIRVWAVRPPADDALPPDPAGVRAALTRWTSARVGAENQVRTP